MKVLVIGNGGREHALAWKIAQSSEVNEVLCAPGNAGTAEVGRNLALDVKDHRSVIEAVRTHEVGLVVIGPEAPLVDGLGDALRKHGVPVFGPDAAGAELEGSKAFAKKLMAKHGIPTAGWRAFDDRRAAHEYLEGTQYSAVSYPVVVKASGLAAGQGVLICEDEDAAHRAVDEMLEGGRFGEAGRTIVIEDFLPGREASIHALTDGRSLFTLPSSMDYKRAFDGGEGPNTGGMGCVSPCPHLPDERLPAVEKEILLPTLHALNASSRPYRGVIYAGLMLARQQPRVLEYNVRFGDPETQVLMPRLEGDLFRVLLAVAEGRLEDADLGDCGIVPGACVGVVLAAERYPEAGTRGQIIEGIMEADAQDGVKVFQAGTTLVGPKVVTDGGRILTVTARGRDVAEARKRAYDAADRIRCEGLRMRRDIGL